ncbi:hypothetical protein DSCA_49130 [Desulfosarcina alkanivorans]|uniref:HicB-like antitoxin of toxin-antitoxin system domain-containing protein n=1 Tax=Desulfosarcina alkanivorans TaxID=571177 RepID=A0A5K7YS29_9BACT|nr:type II toxin-antitoxin system HicB family antitoxin [Desulfosarcina alkanivorans]BBO70983.1 hypothetical protein DSCA_49130 [Desulfosarcina alkanivorans]
MEKDLQYYMSLNYPFTVEKITDDGENYFSLELPDLPGCGSYGTTIEEAIERLDEAKELWLEASIKRGLYISEPVNEDDFSGKFLLRIPTRLHMNLSRKAKIKNISLNQYVKSVLEEEDNREIFYEYLTERDQKLVNILETQSRLINRLERRIHSLENEVNRSFRQKEPLSSAHWWTSNDSYYQPMPHDSIVCSMGIVNEPTYTIAASNNCIDMSKDEERPKKDNVISLRKRFSSTAVTSFSLEQSQITITT